MSFSLILFIIIHLAALIFFIETLRRVSKRVAEYELRDNRTTLPFGLIRLRHIVVLYAISYVLWMVVSIVLYSMFIHNPTAPLLTPSEKGMGVELNL